MLQYFSSPKTIIIGFHYEKLLLLEMKKSHSYEDIRVNVGLIVLHKDTSTHQGAGVKPLFSAH